MDYSAVVSTATHTQRAKVLAKILPISVLIAFYGKNIGYHTSRGNKLRCVLPGHIDVHPSAKIYETKNKYVCFACGESLDIVGLVCKMEEVDFAEGVRRAELVAYILGYVRPVDDSVVVRRPHPESIKYWADGEVILWLKRLEEFAVAPEEKALLDSYWAILVEEGQASVDQVELYRRSCLILHHVESLLNPKGVEGIISYGK